MTQSAWDSTQAQQLNSNAPNSTSAWDATPATPIVASSNPVAGNSFLQNLVIGAGKGFSDFGMGVKQAIDAPAAYLENKFGGQKLNDYLGLQNASDIQAQDRKIVDESKKIDAPLMDTVGGKVGNFVAQSIPAVAASFIPGGQTLTGSILTGSMLGGIQPIATGDSMINNVIFGGIGGGVGYGGAKLLGSALGGAKSLAEPLYDTGQNNIVGRALNSAAGSAADADAARNALSNAKILVPGSLPTVGQASGNPSLAALERTATQTSPAAVNAMTQRIAQQNAARSASLSDLAGSDGAKDYFAADRSTTASKLYNEAFDSGIDPSVASQDAVQQSIHDLMSRPSIQAAQDQAKKLALEGGRKLNNESSLEGLHYTKMALDDQISAAQRAGNDNLVKFLSGTSEKLESLMNTLSPKYAEARQTYAAMSKPLNQMDIAQALSGKVNSLTGNLQPNAYANAISDATAAKATGFPGATLENTMTSDQLATINAVKQDLLRSHFAQNAGKAGSDTTQKLAYSNMLDSAGIPTWLQNSALGQVPGNLVAKAANMVYGDANGGVNKAISDKLIDALMNPATAAKYMNNAAKSPAGSGIISNAMRDSAPLIGDVGAPYTGAITQNYITQGGKNTSNP